MVPEGYILVVFQAEAMLDWSFLLPWGPKKNIG